MSSATPFASIQRVLERSGYVLVRLGGSHRLFRHGDRTKPEFLLPLKNSGVTEAHVLAVRRILDESGVLAAEAFDQLIGEPPQARRKSA